MPLARSLQEFGPLAREAYLAFYSGFRASSIAALIPAMEGAITKLSSQRSGTDIPLDQRIDHAIGGAIETAADRHFDGMWVPPQESPHFVNGHASRLFGPHKGRTEGPRAVSER